MAQLRVWHKPQIPCLSFYVPVESPKEAVRILEILANYDIFQFKNNIKPDYSNVAGLEELDDDDEWTEWYDPETGDCIDKWAKSGNESQFT